MNQVQHRIRPVAVKPKSTGIAYLLFFVTGMIGFHMFYVRRPGMAIAKILTGNFVLVGIVIDAILMPRYVEAANAQGH